MRHLLSPLDFSVEELDELLALAQGGLRVMKGEEKAGQY